MSDPIFGRFVFALLLFAHFAWSQTYDIVLRGGRVMDPESGLDAVRHVGINANKIVAISTRPLKGRVEVDAAGLVIAPGFIDLHQHSHTDEAYRYKAMDGVTTALEMEVGVYPVAKWYAEHEGKSLINFGASAGHIAARMAIMGDSGGLLPRDAAIQAASATQQEQIEAAVRRSLQEGGLGMGMGITYTPNAGADEIIKLFYLAGEFKRPVFVHMRSTGNVITALQEVVANAVASGAGVHVMHLNSAALQKTPDALRFIDGLRARRIDFSTEIYPYIASMTEIASEVYANWEKRPDADFQRLLWPPTGERLTRESFLRYRKQGGFVAQFGNTEEMIRLAIQNPNVMIASDGIIEKGLGHPRGAGTYARVLGKYVREDKALTLMDAIRRCALMPAQRLETMAPTMRSKGRIKVGADADIVAFDADRVIDKATFQNAAQYSEGFRYVLVNGTFVVKDGKLQEGAAPGQGVKAQ